MDHPFDARRVMLSEQAMPHSMWRPVSLISTLRAALLRESGASTLEGVRRKAWLRQIVDELTSRGLDGDSVVRYGLGPELVGSITIPLLLECFPSLGVGPLSPARPGEPVASFSPGGGAWKRILAPEIECAHGRPGSNHPPVNEVVGFMVETTRKVVPWLMSASLDDLLGGASPEPESVRAAANENPPAGAVLESYRWIVERFAVTHLRDWSTSSLHLEYGWISEKELAPCADELMKDRVVLRSELTEEIARRVTFGHRAGFAIGPVGMDNMLASKMQQQATELLRGGRFRESATLFEFALSQDPEDPVALNNLGFCLIPGDPREALKKLQHAHKLGYVPTVINLYNRSLCHIIVGDYRVALSLIGDAWSAMEDTYATLWVLTKSGLEIKEGLSCRSCLAQLAKHAADQLSDTDMVQRWTDRLVEIESFRE
ncbi:MAG TPA: hypothetical protein VG317_04615 [Pseudonocardiaceae bacterium]|jgi:hypothetical protein|nr:hypothetical protein [Pseudonocardiaceae bacterium]